MSNQIDEFEVDNRVTTLGCEKCNSDSINMYFCATYYWNKRIIESHGYIDTDEIE